MPALITSADWTVVAGHRGMAHSNLLMASRAALVC